MLNSLRMDLVASGTESSPTPALSPEERENRWQRLAGADALIFD